MSELKNLCDQILKDENFKSKVLSVDLALCHLDDLKQRILKLDSADKENFQISVKFIDQILSHILTYKEQLLSYNACDNQEVNLLDMLLFVEIITLSFKTQQLTQEGVA